MRNPATLLVLALCALGLLFALRVAVRSYLGEMSDFERAPPTEISKHPERCALAGLQEVAFRHPDGIKLAGWYVPSGNRAAIVLVHGTNSDRSSLLDETRILVGAGFGVLAFDLPGQGASEGHTRWGRGERLAVSAAVDWLTTRTDVDPNRIGGFGLSLGGYILAQAAVDEPRLRSIVLSATPTDVVEETRLASGRWGLLSELPAVWALRRSGMPFAEMRPIDVISRVAPREVFIIGGELDRWVPPRMTRSLYEAAVQPKSLWILARGSHGGYVTTAPQEYAARLSEFFARSLLGGPGSMTPK